MSLITLYTSDGKKGHRRPLYRTFHPLSSKYLYREGEEEFICLCDIDGSSPSVFSGAKEFVQLINEIEIVIKEATVNGDLAVVNHFKEVLVLCKFCIWQEESSLLEFSPAGAPISSYPQTMPARYVHSLPDDI